MLTAGHQSSQTAAWVDAEPLDAADVDATLRVLRAGPRAALLPDAATSEGRQLRRWVTQTLVARRLLEHEARRRGLDPATAPSAAEVLPGPLAAVGFGGVIASVLRHCVAARSMYAAVTSGVGVPEEDVASYVRRNNRLGHPVTEPAARTLLTESRRREAFLDWFAAESTARVRLEHGYEHPGDPHQPDATHRH